MSTRRNQVLIRELVNGLPSVERMKKVKALLERGFSPNVQADDGSSPLMLAAEQGDVEIVKLFLAQDANPDAVNVNRQTALTIAASFETEAHRDICYQLIKAGARLDGGSRYKNTQLLVACLRGDITSVEKYLEQGANINTSISLRRYPRPPLDEKDVDLASTPLMIAIDRRYEMLVELLVSKGAEIYCHIRKETIFKLIAWQMQMEHDSSDRKDVANVLQAVLRGAVIAGNLDLVNCCLRLGKKFNRDYGIHHPVSDTDYRAIKPPSSDQLNGEAIIVNHFRKIEIKPLPLFNVNVCNQQGMNAFDLAYQKKAAAKEDLYQEDDASSSSFDKSNEVAIYEALLLAGAKPSSLSSCKSQVLSSTSSSDVDVSAASTSIRTGKRKARSNGDQTRAAPSIGHDQYLAVPDIHYKYQEKRPEQNNKLSHQQASYGMGHSRHSVLPNIGKKPISRRAIDLKKDKEYSRIAAKLDKIRKRHQSVLPNIAPSASHSSGLASSNTFWSGRKQKKQQPSHQRNNSKYCHLS